MAFPTSTPTKVNLDQSTDSAAAARSELVTLIDLVTQLIESYAQINGICDLDEAGKIPAARIPAGSGSAVDADLLDGQHGAFYRSASNLNAGTLPAARFADVSHGNRGGGSQHTPATQTTAGFLAATDKQKVDSIASDIATAVAAATTTNAINGKLAATAVYAVGSYVFGRDTSLSVDTNPGGTRAGSSLRPACVAFGQPVNNGDDYGSGMAGTWRCMGYSNGSTSDGNNEYPATLWLRIS